MPQQSKALYYRYRFFLYTGREKVFYLELDPDTLDIINPNRDKRPDWTLLKNEQCPNCTLDPALNTHCPIALNLVDIVETFGDSLSYDETEVLIETPKRNFSKQTSLQEGLSSVVGIYMVTSGCPVMQKLKPMVRHHLPFASEDETMYRVMSMYLLAQYLLYRQGKAPDWDMKNLVKVYDEIRLVNKGMSQRLSHIHIRDASLNAVVNLDCFAMAISFVIDQSILDDLEAMFKAYL